MRTVRVKQLKLEWDFAISRWVCRDNLVAEVDIEPGVEAEDVLAWSRVNFPEVKPWEFALEGFVDQWRVDRQLRKQEIMEGNPLFAIGVNHE